MPGRCDGVRAVALVGPTLSGKTSLMEALLQAAGSSDRPGSVGDQSPEARAREHSTEPTFAGLSYLDDRYTLIDCPGAVDFGGDQPLLLPAADLVLIPCRPSAFDLAAIKTTASLVKMRGKPAFVIFTAGSPTAPRMYDEAAQLVQDYGLDACPHHIADRAAFRHAAAEGKTAMEIEPNGKAADEVRQLYKWACKHVNMPTFRKRRASA